MEVVRELPRRSRCRGTNPEPSGSPLGPRPFVRSGRRRALRTSEGLTVPEVLDSPAGVSAEENLSRVPPWVGAFPARLRLEEVLTNR